MVADIIIVAVVGAAFVAGLIKVAKGMKSGTCSGCGGNCSGCGSSCHTKTKDSRSGS